MLSDNRADRFAILGMRRQGIQRATGTIWEISQSDERIKAGQAPTRSRMFSDPFTCFF